MRLSLNSDLDEGATWLRAEQSITGPAHNACRFALLSNEVLDKGCLSDPRFAANQRNATLSGFDLAPGIRLFFELLLTLDEFHGNWLL